MFNLKVGDRFPQDVVFMRVQSNDTDPKSTGMPEKYNASKQWEGKKVLLISVPGAFTPGCQGVHIVPYIEKLQTLKSKGVDIVAVIGANDPWVMSAWGKVNGMTDKNMLFLSDTGTKFAEKIGWMAGPDRNARWAMVIDKDGTIRYAEKEEKPAKVTVSGVDAVLPKL